MPFPGGSEAQQGGNHPSLPTQAMRLCEALPFFHWEGVSGAEKGPEIALISSKAAGVSTPILPGWYWYWRGSM